MCYVGYRDEPPVPLLLPSESRTSFDPSPIDPETTKNVLLVVVVVIVVVVVVAVVGFWDVPHQ
ncbi:hypothetical protein AALP_AA8G130000 [Arabis alpina]|uniref:Uncharacterized protein n=1 Tax=Arabis alpina TaxID=50452 RepID=A0A087G6Q2_ARAAL|nr:hypothetical protein AALP_AA8G130000 [Arabis alpina]